jgi:drug/metabolite transporter (DMT)-like permease
LIWIKRTFGASPYFASMSLPALGLVLLASLAHAFWNLLAKKTGGGLSFIWLTYLAASLIFFPVILYLGGQESWKLTSVILVVAVGSAVLRLGYFILLQTGYRKSDLSVVYPLARGSAPMFSTLGAITIFREHPTTYAAAGLLLIISGVLVITRLDLKNTDARMKKGILFGIVTGFVIGLYTLWDKEAVSHYLVSPILITFTSNVLGMIVLAPPALRDIQKLKTEVRMFYWNILAVAVLSPVSYLLVLEAMKTTPVIYVAPARELSIVFAVFMGKTFMDEKDTRRRFAGSMIILAGIVFLSLG